MTTLIFLIIIVIVVTIFSVQNALPVSISFLAWQFNSSLAIIALLFFLAGMVMGAGILFWIRMRKNARRKQREKEEAAKRKADSSKESGSSLWNR